jgi:SMP-30/Gluconolactonase/LRE-like region
MQNNQLTDMGVANTTKAKRPRAQWDFDLGEVSFIGRNLRRPECVLSTERGDLFVAALGHGVVHITPSGDQHAIGDIRTIEGTDFIPNGLTLEPDGSFLVTNVGEGGGLWRLSRDGAIEPVLREVDGQVLSATNFVLRDWQWPISRAFSPLRGPVTADGYLVLIDERGARIVADNLAFANEVRLDPGGHELYVVETYARRISKFDVDDRSNLSSRTSWTEFGHGSFPDGIAFDAEGFLWVASMTSNRLFRVAPDGEQTLLLEDTDADYLDTIEQRLEAGTLRREDVQQVQSKLLKNIASVTFGGPDLRTVYLGSLGGDSLAVLRSPVAGEPLPHWTAQ